MEAIARHRGAPLSAQKARLVVDQIRGLPVSRALDVLGFMPKKAALLVKKILDSAIANAENNHGADVDDLKVVRAYVDEGVRIRRWHARAKGRGNRIVKRTCHISIVVSEV